MFFNEIFNFEKLFDFFNYIFWFFILNVLFWLLNIPLIIFLVFIGLKGILIFFPLFLLCILPTMPSFTVILYCMNKLYNNKSIRLLHDFIRGFKLNFLQSFLVWFIELLAVFFIYSNIRFFTIAISGSLILNSLFICLLILITVITPYIYLLISRFSMSSLQIIRLSFILTFTRPLLTITNILLALVFLVLFEIFPSITTLFISTAYAFSMIHINKALLKHLEDISKKNN